MDPNNGKYESARWGSAYSPGLYMAVPDVPIMTALLERGAEPNACGRWRNDVTT